MNLLLAVFQHFETVGFRIKNNGGPVPRSVGLRRSGADLQRNRTGRVELSEGFKVR